MNKIVYAKKCNHSNRYFREVLIKNQLNDDIMLDYQCQKCRLDELKKQYEYKKRQEIFNQLSEEYGQHE